MNKYRIPACLFCFLVVGVFFFYSCDNKIRKDEEKPNIVFILADDLGYGDVSCFNAGSRIKTVNLDELAGQGVRFTDAHTSSAVCSPTRYGIVTGRYSWRSTLKKGVLSGYSKSLIRQEQTTVAEFLKENGYKTAFFGKWHLGWDWGISREDSLKRDNLNALPTVDFSKRVQNGPDTHGFDYSYGFCGSLDMAPYVWVENGKPTMVPEQYTVNNGYQSFWRKGLTSCDFVHNKVLPDVTCKTVEYIRENAGGDQPFFVYMPLPAPHTPVLPTGEFIGKSGLDNSYADFVIMVDAMIGKVLDVLKEKGIEDNTLLIFTSDNGCSPRADFEQLATKGHDPSFKFRGHKADIFEGGHRVPYIVRWPEKVKSGISDQLICTTDLFATLADLLDVKLDEDIAEDSYSFLRALNLKSSAPVRESVVLHSVNGSFAFRKGDWKVILCPGSGGWSFPKPNSPEVKNLPDVQLYNLQEDIEETHNLQAQYPDRVVKLKKELTSVILDGRSTPGPKKKNDGPQKWEQLTWMDN